jgi:glycosyltransferase involved in cell wall biosynthesis
MDLKNYKIYHINNIASVAETLVKELKKKGLNVYLEKPSLDLAKYPLFVKVFSLINRQISALKILKKVKNQKAILHIHYSTYALFFLATTHSIIVHAHGSDVRISKKNILRRLLNWIIFKRANKILYSTPDLEEFIKPFKEKTIFLPNPTDFFSDQDTGDLKEKSKKILLFSSLTHVKGAKKSLEALKIFKKEHPECEITIIKNGELFEEPLNETFNVLDIQDRKNLPNIIDRHGIILGQFHIGAIGMSELEAMSRSKPVIAYFKYNNKYKEKSPILNAYLTEEIVNQISFLYGKPDVIKKVGDESKTWAQNNHYSPNICNQLVEIYESLI